MKIFITNINSELGYHLTQLLRQDHLQLNEYTLISGTISQSQSFLLHNSIHQTFHFIESRDIAVKNALTSDVIILDIRNDPGPQVQFILKVLKHYNRKTPLKVIGISNYMTWSNGKIMRFKQTPCDKQTLLQYSANPKQWIVSSLLKQHYHLRVPHPIFAFNHFLEQQIIQLKYYQQMIEPTVFCAGVIYGKSGFDLKMVLQSGLQGKNCELLSLSKQNIVNKDMLLPFLHIDQLLAKIEQFISQRNQSTPNEYLVLCQNQSKSISKIIEKVYQMSGNLKNLDKKRDQLSNNNRNLSTKNLGFGANSAEANLLIPSSSEITEKNQNTNSSQLICSNAEKSSFILIPQIKYAKNKKLFSFLMNIKFTQKESAVHSVNQSIKQSIKHQKKDSILLQIKHLQKKQYQQQKKQIKNQGVNSIVQKAIKQYLQYYEVKFNRLIISEEVISKIAQNQQNKKGNLLFLDVYPVINKNFLNVIFNDLIQNGHISQERLKSPEQNKKNNKNQNVTANTLSFERFFSEVINVALKKLLNSNFFLCLKQDLINKTLQLLAQPDFKEFNHLKFINLTIKELNSKASSAFSLNISQKHIEKQIELGSDEFKQFFEIKKKKLYQSQQVKNIKIAIEELQDKTQQILTTQIIKQKVDQPNSIKINLFSQYLLDNLIIYLAEAKQKLKTHINSGQKIEGKQIIKFFIQQLKNIKARQISLIASSYEEER